MLCGVHLRQHADAEFVLGHGGFDARVIAEALEVFERARGFREVGEWEEFMKGVGCFVVDFARVAVVRGACGLDC